MLFSRKSTERLERGRARRSGGARDRLPLHAGGGNVHAVVDYQIAVVFFFFSFFGLNSSAAATKPKARRFSPQSAGNPLLSFQLVLYESLAHRRAFKDPPASSRLPLGWWLLSTESRWRGRPGFTSELLVESKCVRVCVRGPGTSQSGGCMFPSGFSSFLPQSKNMHLRCDSKCEY